MAGHIGKIEAFDSTVEDWATYIERLEQYLEVNDIPPEKHVAALLSVIGGKTYSLVRNLTAQEKASSKSFKEIVQIVQEHMSPKPLVIAERFRYHKRNQQEGETVSEFAAQLRKLAEHCEFKDGLNDALRDRFVCGLCSENIQKRLLTEDNITFKRAIEIAVAMETAAKDTLELQNRSKAETLEKAGTEVHRVGAEYKKLFKDTPLQKTKLLLKTYTGQKIVPLRVLNAKVEYNNFKGQLDLYVVETGGPALWGREWLHKIPIDWKSIKMLHSVSAENSKPVEQLKAILAQASEVFKDGMGTLKHIKANICLEENAQPKFHKARPVPYSIRPKVEAELDRLEQNGVISKVSWSDWGTPIVPIIKRDGSVRICGDFKVSINPVLQSDKYPLPLIEDIFASLAGGLKFNKIDLAQAYLQMEVEENAKHYLTINTPKGLYRYNRLVFGIASAPAIWQRAMDQVLQGIPHTKCYLDDIIVTGTDESEHLENLKRVLTRLEEYGLRANKEKCAFFKDSIQYCGHIIDASGLHKSPEKIQAVLQAPLPKDVTQLRSFLGFINYYSRFVPNLATVLYPLNQLLQKGQKWEWSVQCDKVFKEAKTLVTSDDVLVHFNASLPLKLACDASPYGIGAVISHVLPDKSERPIAFASRSLTSAERNYAQIDKEALSLIWGVKRFNQFLYGRKFTLVTDHQPLVAILHPKKGVSATAAAHMQRWALFLAGYDYDIEFKRTAAHANADGLSRLPLPGQETSEENAEYVNVHQIDCLPLTCKMIENETKRDPTLACVYEATLKGWKYTDKASLIPYYSRRHELTIHEGCVMWGVRVIIPKKLQSRVLDELHEGHLGIVKMKSLARSFVWWPGIYQQIEQLANKCHGCQQVQSMPQPAPVHLWEWPSAPWQRIHIDFAGPFLGLMFFIIVDAHSKWPEVFGMKSTSTSYTIDILRTLFARTGIPEQIVSDNGPQFISEEFQLFMKRNGIKHTTSNPYHPATNGLAERFVQTMKQSLRSMINDSGSLQHKLARFLLSYRNAIHATTSCTPAMLFMGRNLRSRLDLLKPDLSRHVRNHQFNVREGERRTLRQLSVGQTVLARNYRGPNKWLPAIVTAQRGPCSYTVRVADNLYWRRHIDQLRNTAVTTEQTQTQGLVGLPLTKEVPLEPQTVASPEATSPVSPTEMESTFSEASVEPGCSEYQVSSREESNNDRRYPQREHRPPDRLNL
eukprot:XP_017949515.1 PREDICTED: uncharacterized protein K02A2.6-like [Xenopus tropicalis]